MQKWLYSASFLGRLKYTLRIGMNDYRHSTIKYYNVVLAQIFQLNNFG